MTPAERAGGRNSWESWGRRLPGGRSELSEESVESGLDQLREFGGFLLPYKFAVEEIVTRLRIWSEEFDFTNEHDPIQHITHRVKSPEAIVAKLRRRSHPLSTESARKHLTDLAGVRVVCPLVSDVYLVRDLLRGHDTEVVETKDYIAAPKPNGYRSLHLIVRTPVVLSNRTMHVTAELQLRTIAMDFWATLEHELYYKHGQQADSPFLDELESAAVTAADLDARMESLYQQRVSRRGD
ncbi:GTP pyrophosphokinase [Parasphingorhabdus pacifica]